MSTRWTRVPQTAPPLDALQLRLLPVANAFMALMLSRPGGLSLRTTWVTPGTIWLCLGVLLLLVPLAVGLLGFGIVTARVLLMLGGLVACALAAGTGIVALYGVRQRLLAGPGSRVSRSE